MKKESLKRGHFDLFVLCTCFKVQLYIKMLYAGMIIATIAGYVFFCNVSNLDVYLMKPERQHFCVFFFYIFILHL